MLKNAFFSHRPRPERQGPFFLLPDFLKQGGGSDLHAPLCRVGSDGKELFLAGIHSAGFGHIPGQMDGVELAAGGAQAAADAAVCVHCGGAAAKAALGFGLYLLFRKGQAQVVEGLPGHSRLLSGDLALRVVEFLHHDVVLVKLDETAQVSGQSQGIAGMDETVDGLIALTARCDGVDGEPGARKDVAANEDVGLCGLEGYGIGFGRSVPVQLHPASRKQLSPFHGLADGIS